MFSSRFPDGIADILGRWIWIQFKIDDQFTFNRFLDGSGEFVPTGKSIKDDSEVFPPADGFCVFVWFQVL